MIDRNDTDAIVRAADPVTGWMSDSELRWLIAEARKRERIVEVGAFCGRSTLALAMASVGQIVSVDTWRGEPQDYPELVNAALHATWIRNLSWHIAYGQVEWFTGTLKQYAATRPERPDFIFIDGDHTPDGVIADCKAAQKLAASGATIAGHDWPHEGLADAVLSVFPHAECVTDRVWVANHDR